MKKLFTFLLLLISARPMAQTNAPITVSAPNIVINGTKLKIKPELFAMTYNQAAKYVSLSWKVTYCSDSLGYYGSPIILNGISYYLKETIADNRTKVDPKTGAILKPDAEGKYPEGAIGQYDFFYYLAENKDINVHDLIRAYGASVEEW